MCILWFLAVSHKKRVAHLHKSLNYYCSTPMRKMNSVHVYVNSSSDASESNPLQQDVKPVVACRGCLTTERPLRFLNHKMADEFRLILSPIQACDSCLWYMCSYCCALLLKFRSFREKCILAQNALQKSEYQVAGVMKPLDVIKSISKNFSHPLQKLDLPPLNIVPDKAQNNVNKLIKHKKLGVSKAPHVIIDPSCLIKHENNQDNQKIKLQDTGKTVNKNCTDFSDDSMDVEYLELESLEFEDELSTIEIMNQPLIDEQNAFNEIKITNFQLSDVKSKKSKKDGISLKIAKTSKCQEKRKVHKFQMIDEKELQMLKIKRVRITKEEQKQEILKRKEDPKYESSPYKCDLCYLRFLNKVTFNNHMERHRQKEGHMQCDICYVYVQKKKLTQHKHSFHTYSFFCGQCDHVGKSVTVAKDHYQWHKGFKYKCKICGKAFNKATSVMGHMHLSHKDVMIKCHICGKECIGEKGLKAHMNLSHKEAIGAVCSCGVQFHSVEALQRHRPQGECDPTTRPCIRCGLGFASKLLLRQHESVCDSKKQYSCEYCNLSFESQISYKKHVHSHTRYGRYTKQERTNGTSSYICEYCGKNCTAIEGACSCGVKYPKKERTNVTSSYICEHCGKNCITMHLLIRHTRTHTGERPFICDYCGKGFTTKSILVTHIGRHMAKQSGKPHLMFSCRYCEKHFNYPSNRHRHEITNHKGLMKFNCVICGTTFTTKASMQNHMRHTHEGVPWPKRQRNRR